MDNKELISFIKKQKEAFGDKIAILAHHYQKKEIVNLSHTVGDSYKLALQGSKSKAEFIVFCGVKFMAEGAAILGRDNQKVLMPSPGAGCPMADMINAESAGKVYSRLREEYDREIIPVVYVNSNAEVKSFCGEHGGATCTSSNAEKIVRWYLNQGKAVFFFPDYNLGINTAKALGIKDDFIVKVKEDITFEPEGNIKEGRLFLWNGYCHVHKVFEPDDIIKLREKYKGIKIIVHPECNKEVADASDSSGSTEYLLESIKNSPEGSLLGVGTEFNFVSRLAGEYKNKTIVPLRESHCEDMEKTTLPDLSASLKSINDYLEGKGDLKFEIKVESLYKENAKKALQKMIDIVEGL